MIETISARWSRKSLDLTDSYIKVRQQPGVVFTRFLQARRALTQSDDNDTNHEQKNQADADTEPNPAAALFTWMWFV